MRIELIAVFAAASVMLAVPHAVAAEFNFAAQREAAIDQIKSKLKDPSSAEFKDVRSNGGRGGVKVICGRVNAKNGFGGKNGFQRFISSGLANTTWLEEEVVAKDFSQIWSEFCM